ncbi:MAG: lysophospholipid acyltransferase family protein [Calditrichia bacterium]
MIEANPSASAGWMFSIYLKRLLKKHFFSVRLLGDVPEPAPEHPLLLLPNHSTWWDGFFAWQLNEQLFRRPFYLMMLQEQLQKYTFFRKLGVFGIDPVNPKGMLSSLNYSVNLLNQLPPPILTVFPQGELLPTRQSPLGYKKGVDWILKRYAKPINLLPLAIRCEFTAEQLPLVFFEFGDLINLSSSGFEGIHWLEEQEMDLLNQLDKRIIAGERGLDLMSFSRSNRLERGQ